METVIVVIVSACNFLMIDPVTKTMTCKDFELPPFTEKMSAHQCLMGSQPIIAKMWYPRHPGWSINKITCEVRNGIGKGSTKKDI